MQPFRKTTDTKDETAKKDPTKTMIWQFLSYEIKEAEGKILSAYGIACKYY